MLIFASLMGVCRALGYVSFSGNPVGSSFYNGSFDGSGFPSGSLPVGGGSRDIILDGKLYVWNGFGWDCVGGSPTVGDASIQMSGVISAGVISLVICSVALAVVCGFHILGSGLGSVSVMAIFKSAAYYGIWCLFSVAALILFGEIPLFGYPLYFMLTLFYSVGVVQSVGFMGD
jgi:hypothetical protein